MKTKLNGLELFDEHNLKIEVGSIERDTIERAIGGLDGKMSIDLGQRGRVITQTGTLRARSKAELEEKIGSICDYMDGYPYSLVTADGRRFDNVRIDAFKTKNRRPGGAGLAIDYEIIYTQLLCE